MTNDQSEGRPLIFKLEDSEGRVVGTFADILSIDEFVRWADSPSETYRILDARTGALLKLIEQVPIEPGANTTHHFGEGER